MNYGSSLNARNGWTVSELLKWFAMAGNFRNENPKFRLRSLQNFKKKLKFDLFLHKLVRKGAGVLYAKRINFTLNGHSCAWKLEGTINSLPAFKKLRLISFDSKFCGLLYDRCSQRACEWSKRAHNLRIVRELDEELECSPESGDSAVIGNTPMTHWCTC